MRGISSLCLFINCSRFLQALRKSLMAVSSLASNIMPFSVFSSSIDILLSPPRGGIIPAFRSLTASFVSLSLVSTAFIFTAGYRLSTSCLPNELWQNSLRSYFILLNSNVCIALFMFVSSKIKLWVISKTKKLQTKYQQFLLQ